MAPRASTSRAIPPRIATTISTPTSSQRPSRKGKERAIYTPPSYSFDDPEQGLYQPRSGQVKKRTRKLPERGKSTKRKSNGGVLGFETRGKDTGQDTGGSEKDQPKKKRRKRELHPKSTDLDSLNPSSQPDLTPNPKPKPFKAKAKKSVRLDVPFNTTTTSSEGEFGPGDNDTYVDSDQDAIPSLPHLSPKRSRSRRLRSAGPVGETEPISSEEELLDPSALDDLLDYSNPHNLPLDPKQRRSKKYWRSLEFGVYRSALWDAAREENDLGRLVFDWEGLVSLRRKEEMKKEADEGEEADIEEEQKKLEGPKKRGPKPKPKLPKIDRARSITVTPANSTRRSTRARTRSGYSSGANTGIGEEEDEVEEQESDGVQVELPSSQVLARMARWPLHQDHLHPPASSQPHDLPSFQIELESLASTTRTRLKRSGLLPVPPPRPPRPSIRSAYSSTGPFAQPSPSSPPPSSSSSSSSDSDSDSSPLPPSFFSIPSTISRVLLRLLDFVQKEPLPSMDIWSVPKREEVMKIEEIERKGKGEKERTRPGWREVLEVVREDEGVPRRYVFEASP